MKMNMTSNLNSMTVRNHHIETFTFQNYLNVSALCNIFKPKINDILSIFIHFKWQQDWISRNNLWKLLTALQFFDLRKLLRIFWDYFEITEFFIFKMCTGVICMAWSEGIKVKPTRNYFQSACRKFKWNQVIANTL